MGFFLSLKNSFPHFATPEGMTKLFPRV